ncbi:hypothetical protein MC885_017755 [Smutsia gigantea]|nr:hypothetical protein MC885_017755 [Smutsia gigantea]
MADEGMDGQTADEEDEAPSSMWLPLRTLHGPSLPEPDPLDLRGTFSAPTSPASVPPAATFPGTFRPSPPSSTAPLPSGRPAEASEFELRLLDSHRRQGALLASWSQQQNVLMAQQTLLLQRLADGVEALSRTLGRLVQAHPAGGGSPLVLDSTPAGGVAQGPTKGSPQDTHMGLEVFSGMTLKVEEET